MLAYPPGYPHPAQARDARLRASDADRDTVVDILCAAVGDGRLTLAELDGRVGAALSGRTRTELLALISDLPGTPPANGRTPSRSRPRAARSPATEPSRWSLIQSLIDTWATPAPA
jgi:hypothetical protein